MHFPVIPFRVNKWVVDGDPKLRRTSTEAEISLQFATRADAVHAANLCTMGLRQGCDRKDCSYPPLPTFNHRSMASPSGSVAADANLIIEVRYQSFPASVRCVRRTR